MQELNTRGQFFDERYELISVIGRGGLGTVYKALQLDLNRIVAIKVLCPELSQDAEFNRRFQREAQALSKISHPNVVTIYHFGYFGSDSAYIAMEFIEGLSGRQLLGKLGRLPTARALNIIREAALALDFVHSHDLVHRDLKPENLLIAGTDADQVKVIDFGLVGSAESKKQHLTRTGELIGTVHYMSPEQCKGLNADLRSDIYSLGACLYEFLTGEKVFDADTGIGIMYKHLNEAVPAINAGNVQQFCPALNELVCKAMEKDPSKRFHSMRAFSDAISDAADQLEEYKTESKISSLSKRCLALILLLVTIFGMAKAFRHESFSSAVKQTVLGKAHSKLEPAATVHIPIHEAELTKLLDAYAVLGPEATITILKRWEKLHERDAPMEDRAVVDLEFTETYARLGKQKEAELYTNKLLAESRNLSYLSAAVSKLAQLCRRTKHPQKAIEYVEKAMKLGFDANQADSPIFMLGEEAQAYAELNQRNKADSLVKSIINSLKLRGVPRIEDNDFRQILIQLLAKDAKIAEINQLVEQDLEAARIDKSTNPKALAITYLELGRALNQKNTEKLSVDCFKKALDEFIKAGDQRGAAHCLLNIVQIYFESRDFASMLSIYREAAPKVSLQLVEKAQVLVQLSICAEELGKQDVSIKYANEALKLCQIKLQSGKLDFGEQNGKQYIECVLHVIAVFNKYGKQREADALLEKWIDAVGKPPQDRIAAARLYQEQAIILLQRNENDDGLKVLKRLIELLADPAVGNAAFNNWTDSTRILAFAYITEAETLSRNRQNEKAEIIATAIKAKSLLDQAPEVLSEERLSNYVRVGKVFEHCAAIGVANDCYAKAESLIKAVDFRGDRDIVWLLSMAESRRDNKDFFEAKKLFLNSREKLNSRGHHQSKLMRHCLVALAVQLDLEDQKEEARQLMLEALQIPADGSEDVYLSRAYDLLGQYALQSGDYQTARKYFEEELHVCNPEQLKFAYFFLGDLYFKQSKLGEAINVTEEGISRISRTPGCWALDQEYLRRRLGQLYADAGKLTEARDSLLESERFAADIKDADQRNEELGYSSAELSRVAGLAGDKAEECDRMRKAAVLFGKSGQNTNRIHSLQVLLNLGRKYNRPADIEFASKELKIFK